MGAQVDLTDQADHSDLLDLSAQVDLMAQVDPLGHSAQADPTDQADQADHSDLPDLSAQVDLTDQVDLMAQVEAQVEAHMDLSDLLVVCHHPGQVPLPPTLTETTPPTNCPIPTTQDPLSSPATSCRTVSVI